MQRMTGLGTVVVRQDRNAAQIHVANRIEDLVADWLVVKPQTLWVTYPMGVKDHGIGQRSTTDQTLRLKFRQVLCQDETARRGQFALKLFQVGCPTSLATWAQRDQGNMLFDRATPTRPTPQGNHNK